MPIPRSRFSIVIYFIIISFLTVHVTLIWLTNKTRFYVEIDTTFIHNFASNLIFCNPEVRKKTPSVYFPFSTQKELKGLSTVMPLNAQKLYFKWKIISRLWEMKYKIAQNMEKLKLL